MDLSIASYIAVGCTPTIIFGFYKYGHNDEKHNFLFKIIGSLCLIWSVVFLFLGVLSIYHVRQDNRPDRLFPSYEAIQSHENLDKNIIVYDDGDTKQVRVIDKRKEWTVDYIVSNDDGQINVSIK